MPPKSVTQAPNFDGIPEALRVRPHWVLWRWLWDESKERWTKCPFRVDGRMASSTEPEDLTSFDEARRAFERGPKVGKRFDGLELMLVDGLAGVDLDHILDDEGNVTQPWAEEVIDQFKDCAYIELSQSETGVHIYCIGDVVYSGKSGPENRLEVYDQDSPRFFVVTGRGEGEVQDGQAALDWLHATHFANKRPKIRKKPEETPRAAATGNLSRDDAAVVKRLRSAANAAKFERLFDQGQGDGPSASEDDEALACMLSYWTRDPAQIERLMRASALRSEKWDKNKKYLQTTIEAALTFCTKHHPSATKPGKDKKRSSSTDDDIDVSSDNPLAIFDDFIVSEDYVQGIQAAELIGDIVVRGHLAAWVGPGGSGKTLIAMHVAGELAAQGFDVVYIHEDTGAGELPAMQGYASKRGFALVNSNVKLGAGVADLVERFQALVDARSDLSKTVLVIDTLKKMVDLNSKQEARQFLMLARSLTMMGATVIALGHTNKNAGIDGKLVHEGVGDVRNDVDELLYFTATPKDLHGVVTVSVRMDKTRAMMPELVSYEGNVVTREVRQLDRPVDVETILEREQQEKADVPLVVVAKQILREQSDGKMTLTKLVEAVYERATNASRREVQAAIDRNISNVSSGLETPLVWRSGGFFNAKIVSIA